MRRSWLLAGALATGLVLTACGGGSGSGSGSSGGGGDVRVAAVIKGLDNPFFRAMQKGIAASAKQHGVDATIQAAQDITDTTGQADKLSALAQQNFDCYIVNPISGSNLVSPLARVAAKDKPIVNIDLPLDEDTAEAADVEPATYVGTDNEHQAEIAGRHMVQLLKPHAKVARIGGIAGDVTSQQRLEGFADAVEGKLDIVQTTDADWVREKAYTAAKTILRAHPDLSGFFVANDDMGLGVVRAVQQVGKADQVRVISGDGIKSALRSVQKGELAATVSQYPYVIGKMGLEACLAATAGKKLPDDVDAPVALVTKQNVGKAREQFPKPFSDYDDPFAKLAK